jgi:hypothetical protein
LRLASGDTVAWRNNANSADIVLFKNTSDQLFYNGNQVLDSRTAGGCSAGQFVSTVNANSTPTCTIIVQLVQRSCS